MIFLPAAVVLLGAHLHSGVFTGSSTLVSALLVPVSMVPVSMAGLCAGFRLQDRLDAARLRRWTPGVLASAALNLIRWAWVLWG